MLKLFGLTAVVATANALSIDQTNPLELTQTQADVAHVQDIANYLAQAHGMGLIEPVQQNEELV